MPAGPGEKLLTTLFADVHYYFNAPTAKPQHHRFSRGSYVYLFHNTNSHTAKLEIANHAGTPDQDAFSGDLTNLTRLSYSYKQPNLITLIVDCESVQGHETWHLPSYDEQNQKKYLYKIHTLDLYMWTEKDAATMLGHLKAVLPVDKQEIKDAPSGVSTPAEHRDSMSPVVQQLEKTAIGAQFPPRAESAVSAVSLPGPPTPATSGGVSQQPTPIAAYNPAAPAAPEPVTYREKTPPPADDGTGTGLANAAKYDSVPQAQYANVPNTYQKQNSNQVTPQGAYFAGPPQQAQPQQQQQQTSPPPQQQQQVRHPSMASFAGPPTASPSQTPYQGYVPPPPPPPPGQQQQQQQQQYNPSFAPPPNQQQTTSPPPHQQSFHRQSSYGQPVQQYANYNPQQHQQQQQQHTPSFGPTAVASPGMPGTPGQQPPTPSAPPAYTSPLPSAGLPGQQQQQNQQSQQQTFGYSNYNYAQQQGQQPAGYNPSQQYAYTGDVHSQVYRPTEAEAAHGHSAPTKPQQQRQNSETKQRLEEKVREVESGVGKYLKRLDKLW